MVSRTIVSLGQPFIPTFEWKRDAVRVYSLEVFLHKQTPSLPTPFLLLIPPPHSSLIREGKPIPSFGLQCCNVSTNKLNRWPTLHGGFKSTLTSGLSVCPRLRCDDNFFWPLFHSRGGKSVQWQTQQHNSIILLTFLIFIMILFEISPSPLY